MVGQSPAHGGKKEVDIPPLLLWLHHTTWLTEEVLQRSSCAAAESHASQESGIETGDEREQEGEGEVLGDGSEW